MYALNVWRLHVFWHTPMQCNTECEPLNMDQNGVHAATKTFRTNTDSTLHTQEKISLAEAELNSKLVDDRFYHASAKRS